jgi:hypothetical protein
MVENEVYPLTELFTAQLSPNVPVVVSNTSATPNPVVLSKRLLQQAVWTSATTGSVLTGIDILPSQGQPSPPFQQGNGLLAGPNGVCASGPIAANLQSLPQTYTYKVKIGGQPGPTAVIRIDP